MKKIIYATDLSENSVAALHYSTQMARILGDDLIVLHVYPPNEAERKNPDFFKRHQKDLEDFYKSHLQENYDKTIISPAVTWGSNVADEILKFSKDLNVRMIVMGSCGASKFKDRLMGTTTGEMIGKSQTPILAVPPEFKFRQPQ
ncbi:universal stress protein [Salinimicrobium xinjiangense]|uniref:universal stress protein n=1 Tax=Salinimicrobium xinjiangense TaxID=438596 RepID=UPI000405283F|nr:universal stress protein [Salinimicrobium xinjiangense]